MTSSTPSSIGRRKFIKSKAMRTSETAGNTNSAQDRVAVAEGEVEEGAVEDVMVAEEAEGMGEEEEGDMEEEEGVMMIGITPPLFLPVSS